MTDEAAADRTTVAAVRDFAGEFDAELSAQEAFDVRDWCDHNECLLALEVLAEKLFEHGVLLDPKRHESLMSLAEAVGGERSRFDFLRRET